MTLKGMDHLPALNPLRTGGGNASKYMGRVQYINFLEWRYFLLSRSVFLNSIVFISTRHFTLNGYRYYISLSRQCNDGGGTQVLTTESEGGGRTGGKLLRGGAGGKDLPSFTSLPAARMIPKTRRRG